MTKLKLGVSVEDALYEIDAAARHAVDEAVETDPEVNDILVRAAAVTKALEQLGDALFDLERELDLATKLEAAKHG